MRRTERGLGIVAAAGLLAGSAFVAGPEPVAAAGHRASRWRCRTGRRPGSCRIWPTSSTSRRSGNNVKLEADFIPWPVYYERLAASLTSGEKKYQMAVSDSQWLGAFVEGGYYMKINEFVDNDPELQAIFKDLHPNLVASYSTYPHKSENFYGFPQMPDVLVVYYRKDLFCDEDEQEAYQAKYGKKLPCTPARRWTTSTGTQVKNYRRVLPPRRRATSSPGKPLDDDFYGIAYQAGKDYDFAIMQVNAFIWQNGADIWDETKAPNGQAEGVVNSPEAIEALEQLPVAGRVHAAGGQDRDHGHLQDRRAVPRGQGRLDHPVDRLRRERDQPGDLEGRRQGRVRPCTRARRGPDGKLQRWSNIGGQPFVLTTWNSDGGRPRRPSTS